MTSADLIALLPVIVLAASAVMVMLIVALYRHLRGAAILTLIGLLLSIAVLPVAAEVTPRQVTPLMVIDRFALFYIGLIFAATFAATMLCYSYFKERVGRHEELYILLLLAALGAVVLVSSNHFASFFLGLETLSIALFALIAYPVGIRHPLEAGIKYLILSGVSTPFLLFGMALIYAESGTMEFAQIGSLLTAGGLLHNVYMLTGIAMIVTGVGFKLAVVPFHMWTPDVYEGAPAPVTAFVATVSKGAVLALLLRYFVAVDAYRSGALVLGMSLIALASILGGNLLALLQNNIKRILAYSSIAHLGYMLIGLLATGALAIEAVTYYLVTYFVTMLGTFGVVTLLSTSDLERETDLLEDYRGLFWRRPWIAGIFTAMLLCLAGMPLTMGFVGKFYLVAAGISASLWLLIAALVVGSAIGLFYYLRIVTVMCMPLPERSYEKGPLPVVPLSLAGSSVLAVLTLLLVWLGVYPAPLIRMLQETVVRLI